MANIKRIDGKSGPSFLITVTKGRDLNGKQVRHYRTWRPEPGMTERQMEKAAQRAALDFEREIEAGYQVDDRQTFAQYCEYVLKLKERAGCKYRTIERYRELTQRIYPAIGHIKLTDIRPQHLNSLYADLQAPGVSNRGERAIASVDLAAMMKDRKLSRAAVAKMAGVGPSTVTAACQKKKIALATAEAIAKALNEKTDKLFLIESTSKQLASKTVLEYHRLIRTVLAQAEREMLVPYNAAAKATPPKATRKEVAYYQPGEIPAILAALDQEPLKWRMITHLLLVSGCRRGEIMGLTWDCVNFQQGAIRIQKALLYSSKRGTYEDTTKTENSRLLHLPKETMEMLREYRREQLQLQLANGDRWKGSGYLFTKDNGEPMNPDSITAWLSKFAKRHGLPHIHPHAFRHTVASVLIANGVDIVTTSKQLGHAKPSTTENIYAHLIEDAKTQATECIADALLRRKKA